MNNKSDLLKRLNEIGDSLKNSNNALALLGLGSVGKDLDRIDEYSDLDFFAIVKDGCKREYIDNLNWLSSITPISYKFLNSPDGYKIMFEDGIFCEMAVFESHELEAIPFSEGRLIWKSDDFNENLVTPKRLPIINNHVDINWAVGEALTNLYVGLGRFHRGEKLSAARFIQNYAVDRILDLSQIIDTEIDYYKDIFQNERRYEKRFLNISKELPNFIGGYEKSIESALAILEFLDTHFEINQSMKQEILKLCKV